jgi:hypothetical protein
MVPVPVLFDWHQPGRDVQAILAVYDELASTVTIDFDRIAKEAGLRVWRDGCCEGYAAFSRTQNAQALA